MSDWGFLLDENIDPKVARYLDKEGLFAAHVRDALGQGADDEDEIILSARDHDLVIVTRSDRNPTHSGEGVSDTAARQSTAWGNVGSDGPIIT